MSLMLLPLRRYADFQGRSRRSEFWLWQLFNAIVAGVLVAILMGMFSGAMARVAQQGGTYTSDFSSYETSDTGFSASTGTTTTADPTLFMQEFGAAGLLVFLLLILYALLVFIPSLAVSVRRLHDQDKSGWFYLLNFIPFGGLVLLVFYCLPGTPGLNRYGPIPKAMAATTAPSLDPAGPRYSRCCRARAGALESAGLPLWRNW